MGSRYDALCGDARRAYRANRHQEAALLWAEAREVARSLGDPAWAFQAGVWQADAWRCAGEPRRALALLLELLAAAPEDAPAFERWLAELMCYEVWLALRPRAARQRGARLDALATWRESQPRLPAGDLPLLRAELALDRGRFDEALRHAEEAWTAYDGWGYLRYGSAHGAVAAALRSGQPELAARWRAQLASTNQDTASGRAALHRADARIALRAGAPIETLDATLRALQDDLQGTQSEGNAEVRHLLARLYLLCRPAQDPDDPLHPARAALRARPETGRDFERLLVITDLRLASLRYSLGVPPCDDLYYTFPQRVPDRLPPAPPLRLRRLQAALRALREEAALLDELLETDWYGAQAEARAQRTAELLAACDP